MKWQLVAIFAFAAAASGAVAETDRLATHEVGAYSFVVPKDRLFTAAIPWLPAPENDTFTFRLELDQPSGSEHLVLVEPADRVCVARPPSQMWQVACGLKRTRLTPQPPYRKVYPQADYTYYWDYYSVGPLKPAGGEPELLQVAYCTPISPNPARPNGTAICSTVWGADGLVFLMGFEEHELAQLASMRAHATSLLDQWQVR